MRRCVETVVDEAGDDTKELLLLLLHGVRVVCR